MRCRALLLDTHLGGVLICPEHGEVGYLVDIPDHLLEALKSAEEAYLNALVPVAKIVDQAKDEQWRPR